MTYNSLNLRGMAMEKKIVYVCGLWSHPKAVHWIKNNLESATGLPVELFDYHDILIEDIDSTTYIKRVLEKYGDAFSTALNDLIPIGHSHGGALSILLAEKFSPEKLVLVNPAFRPWGVLRRVPNQIKYILGTYGIGEGYHPHYIVKYDGEVEERAEYFKQNFDLLRDISRVIETGTEAFASLEAFKGNLLLIQSLQDEFVSVSSSLKFYENLPMPEYSEEIDIPSKEVMMIPDAEHAILEEDGVYARVYKRIDTFVKR